jgi:4-amino-4-deoxy-L-arabinose transferase-like glycosyltransferase
VNRRGLALAAITAITALAAALRLVHLGDVPGNPFYDAAIRTMAQSWHAFIFGALDPGGTVSVDKPPVDLWLQVASVKLLGFTPFALKLPQAIAGTVSVPLLYGIVRRGFGKPAGLIAAAALAVLPVTVLTARSDTMDTVMMALLLGSAWCAVVAAERGRPAPLVAAGVLAGLAFNVKLFEALLPLPAIALIWLVGAAVPWKRRLGGLLAATAVMLVVAFAWIVPVGLTPRSERPYPIGSTDGTIWNVVFVFDGTARLKGRPAGVPDTFAPSAKVPAAIAQRNARIAAQRSTGASPKRLLGRRFGPRIGSEVVPAVIFGLLAALLGAVALARGRRPDTSQRLRLAVGACFFAWLGAGLVLMSAMGAFHPRYFEVVVPAVAGTIGIGVWELVRARSRLALALAGAGVAGCVAYALHLGQPATSARWIAVALGAAAIAALGVALLRRGPVPAALAATLAAAAALVVPLAVSAQVVRPRASDAQRSGAMPVSWPPLLDRYLNAHRGGARYQFASVAPAKAAPLIMLDPQPLLMLTSYRGRPLISVQRLQALVASGQVRYFLLGRRCTGASAQSAACPATARWVQTHGIDVTHATGLPHSGLLYRVDPCRPIRRRPARAQARGHGRTARQPGSPTRGTGGNRSLPARCAPPPPA